MLKSNGKDVFIYKSVEIRISSEIILSDPGSIGGFIVLVLIYTVLFIGLTILIYWRMTKRQREKARSAPEGSAPESLQTESKKENIDIFI